MTLKLYVQYCTYRRHFQCSSILVVWRGSDIGLETYILK